MKTREQVLSALIFSALLSAPAFASDLTRDLRVPFEPMSNPFQNVQPRELNSSLSGELSRLLVRCAFNPASEREQSSAEVRPACASEILPSMERDQAGAEFIGNKAVIRLGGFTLQVVSWDGSHSDGGDEQALGIYDQGGNRIATYPSLFVDGNVIDGLAHAVGARLPVSRK
ncbi:MAG: hypothetical protein ACXVB9_02300 [Bdellovibrionota bacterium]